MNGHFTNNLKRIHKNTLNPNSTNIKHSANSTQAKDPRHTWNSKQQIKNEYKQNQVMVNHLLMEQTKKLNPIIKLPNYNDEIMYLCWKCKKIKCHCIHNKTNKKNQEHHTESLCPKSVNSFTITTSNRFTSLKEECNEKIDEEVKASMTRKIKNTDLFDSTMIKLTKKFPNSIKKYFKKIEEEFPNQLVLPNPNSELNFVEARIGEGYQKAKPIKFMTDIGSSHSVISAKFWNSMPNKHKYELASGTTNFVTPSEESIRGVKRVIVPFYMKDESGKFHKNVYCFYVVDGNLPHHGYIGSDWLQKSTFCHGIFETYFNIMGVEDKKIYKIPVNSMSNTEYTVSINLALLNDIKAMPNKTVKALALAEDKVPDSNCLMIEGYEERKKEGDYKEHDYTIIPTLTDRSDNNVYEIYIKNNSDRELHIDKATPIAEITIDESAINSMQIVFKGANSYINPISMNNCVLKDPRIIDRVSENNHHDLASKNNNHGIHQDMASKNDHHDMVSENNHHDMASKNNNHGIHQDMASKNDHHDMVSGNNHHDLKIYKSMARDKDLADEVYPFNTASHKRKDRTTEAKRVAKKKLDEIECLNEEEKDEKLKEFESKGYFSYPATTIIENSNKVLELKPNTKEKTDEELLAELDLEHLDEEIRNRVQGIFKDNIKVFAKSEYDIPTCPLITAKPELTEEAKRKGIQNTRFRPIPAQIKDKVDNLLDDMVASGILKICDKPTHIVSNLIVTPKKSPGDLRICLDLRTVNSQVLRIPYQLEPLQSVFGNFHKCTYATSVDLSQSYFSCAIEESRQPIFSFFNSRRQLLSYARCPMGYVNSGYYLELISAKIKERCPNVVSFVDDLYLITYDSWTDHCNKLEHLVKTLVEFNLKIKAKKVQALALNLDVLGHQWSKDHFRIPENRVNGIEEWDTPENGDGVASFLGHCNFYRDYLPGFSDAALPLQPLANEAIEYKKKKKLARITKEKVPQPKFKWTQECTDAFNNIKKIIRESNNRYPPDPSAEYFCYSDASLNCASFVCTQRINGQTRLIGACSRKFSKSELNYSVFKKEAKAVIIGLEVFYDILAFAKIHLYVDARSLLFLKATAGSDYILMRWALIMSNYDIEISHISSEQNYVADSLSRSRRIDTTKDDDGLPPLSDADATKILKQIELPDSYTISRELFQKYVSSEGMKSPIKKINKKTTTKAKITNASLAPPKKSRRKVVLPPTSSDHIFYREQRRRLREDPPEFLKQTPSINHMNIEDRPVTTHETGLIQKLNKFIDKTCFVHNTRLEEADNYDDQERIRLNNRIYKDGLITIPMFKECQSMDPVCQKIEKDLTKHKSFFKIQGVLCKRQETTNEVKELLALPKSLIPILRHALHFGILAHHASANNMYLKLKNHYWFPNLREELKRITKSCILCATLKPNAGKQLKFGEKKFPNSPRIGYAFDIACGLPNVNSYQYCYIFLDLFSGYSITVPAKSKSSKEILKAFKTNVIQYFDFPSYLYGDCELGLHAKEMKAFCDAHNIELKHNSPHSAFSNGNCETEINKIKTTLRMLDRGQAESWVDMITYANLGINHRKLTTSGFSPQMLALGQDTQTLALLKESEDFKDQGEYSTFITKRLDDAYEKHRKQRKMLADKNREYVNKSRTEKSFQIGELVVLKNHEIATIGGGSLKDKFHGIYKITSMNKKEKTCILTHIGNGSERGAHLMHLRPIGEENIEDPLPIKNEAINLINKGQKSNSELGAEGRSYNLRSNTPKLNQ